jgi:hypothetical protein
MRPLNETILSLFDYLSVGHYSYAVKLVLFFLISIFSVIVVLSVFTLCILSFHKISLYLENKYHVVFNSWCINYALDQDSPMPTANFFTKKYLRNSILDLLFVTKGFERTILQEIYKANGFWDKDLKRLKSIRWNKRLGALVRLDQWQLCLGYDLLSKLAKDTNPQIRQIAVKNLSRTDDRKEARHLLVILNQEHFFHSTVYESIHRLIKHHPETILYALDDKSQIKLWPFILSAIGNTTMIEAIPRLLEIAKETNDTSSREKALIALGKIGDPRGVPVLTYSLISPKAKERLAGLQALYNIDVYQIKNYQKILRNDPDPLVRNWMNYYLRIN